MTDDNYSEYWPFRKTFKYNTLLGCYHCPLDEGTCVGWRLRVECFDSMENHNPEYTKMIDLAAYNRGQALAEAKKIWAKRKPYTGWNQKEYPTSPVLVFMKMPEKLEEL